MPSGEETVVENDDEEDELILPERKVVQSRYLQKRPSRTLEPAEWEHRDYLAVQAQKERETLRRAMKKTFEASVARGESYAVLKSQGLVPQSRAVGNAVLHGVNPEADYCSPGNPEDEDLVGDDIGDFERRLEKYGTEWAKTPMKTGMRAKATQKTFGIGKKFVDKVSRNSSQEKIQKMVGVHVGSIKSRPAFLFALIRSGLFPIHFAHHALECRSSPRAISC